MGDKDMAICMPYATRHEDYLYNHYTSCDAAYYVAYKHVQMITSWSNRVTSSHLVLFEIQLYMSAIGT